MSSTSDSPLTRTTPRRDSAFVVRCFTCAEPALLRCPRCERPFCQRCAQVSASCADCELELSSRTNRVLGAALTAYGLGAAGGIVYLALASPLVGLLAGGLGVLGGVVAGQLLRRRLRRRARRGWTLVRRDTLGV